MSKLTSRKFWFVIWAGLMFSALSLAAVFMKFDAPWMSGAMTLLAGIIGAYVGIGQAKKKADK